MHVPASAFSADCLSTILHSMPHVGILPYYVGLYKVNCNGPRGMNRQVKHGVRHAIACGIHPFQYKRTLDTDTLIPLIPLIP
ncbi:uncharacterized protein CCOS01_02532 [Colletotrichum costaricense]|uniref:Uncharacterized protein n=2 Tax=Colletotrichum acutatum species complex TaxID=2707335 RepID=A0AAI9Z9M6_9PEZI|nr:uncharacterized protein CCOS01_02532 [Colletotrichum costaricense]XP_060377381.1 uncharacterized protein CTAM01_11963 [Colletotrichum tamarilloi]KAI3530132.1 hypothetical protein CSPX01_15043 [Colletotrichum filicis]KAK1487030.1 hypothetical protein CTAM01_11963 [Colletotrichum tamarilloi]KAK1537212.1 hypothetical protein CCOS01_02532 [Colletotrichum costaricense]